MAMAGLLAACQVVTLVTLWPRPPARDVAPVVPAAPIEEVAPSAPDPNALWVLRERALETEGNLLRPVSHVRLAPSAPPLRAFGAPPAALLH
jgi:hypothetical protein